MLDDLLQKLRLQSEPEPFPCPKCGTPNPGDRYRCLRCRYDFTWEKWARFVKSLNQLPEAKRNRALRRLNPQQRAYVDAVTLDTESAGAFGPDRAGEGGTAPERFRASSYGTEGKKGSSLRLYGAALVIMAVLATALLRVLLQTPVQDDPSIAQEPPDEKIQTSEEDDSHPPSAGESSQPRFSLPVADSQTIDVDSEKLDYSPAVYAALSSLREMAKATEVPINRIEYGSRLSDLKGAADEALRQLPEGEIKNEIDHALQAFVDALTMWRKFSRYETQIVEMKGSSLADEEANRIVMKYSIPVQRDKMGAFINRSATLNVIWLTADQHIRRAAELLKESE